ncbi:Extracellular Matrix protein PelB [Labilithrix luteola]|uniref:Extracellular Matrix protein PelB n=1 Tax=Labilithrix luteola TaxID=1391654 RepID=A0A0K1PKW2_9BACT|nr:hypothetical protein [Labilithrix luteola]AKU93734.1 Extracellular Matrix protein PelB [Labilithrix luteola]
MSVSELGSSANERPRPVFASAPVMLGFAFMMGVVLATVFPTEREFAEVARSQRGDAYSIGYLSVVTRAKPQDAHLRLTYTRELFRLGRWDEALDALPTVSMAPALAPEIKTLKLDIMLARARSFEDDDPRAAPAYADVLTELQSESEMTWSPERTRELARLTLELEAPALAARYYQSLAAIEPDDGERAKALADAGRWLRASGDLARAAESYQHAATTTQDPTNRASYLLASAETLEAMNEPCGGAKVVQSAANESTDPAYVARVTAMMTSCGHVNDARLLGRRLLKLQPDDAQTRSQIRRELAAGDPAAALNLLLPLVKARPQDRNLRATTARVAEWAGQPKVALEHWLWLMGNGYAPTNELALP